MICAAGTVLVSCNKNDDSGNSDTLGTACTLKFENASMYLSPGEERPISLLAKELFDASFKSYDWTEDKYGVTLTVENTELLSISGSTIKSLGPKGNTTVTATPRNGLPVTMNVFVEETGYNVYDKDKPFTAENIFLPSVCTHKWIQSFEFNSKGDIYILSTIANDPWLSIFRYNKSGEKTGEMRLAYASHATTCSLEETEDGDYFWLPTYGTKGTDGNYKRDQLFSRVKFENGRAWSPDEAEFQKNTFYMGEYDNFLPSVDVKNGLIGIRHITLDNKQWVSVYKLEDVMNAPLKPITLKQSITRGGESTGPITTEETIAHMSFTAHNFSGVKPLFSFNFTQAEAIGVSFVTGSSHAVQGFCIADGYAYFMYGFGENFDGGYSVYDFNGNILVKQQHFTFLDDRDNLSKLGVAEKIFEPEGIRVKDGRMYIGAGVRMNSTVGDGLETILVLPR